LFRITMATIVLRTVKGSKLTTEEVDANFGNLNNAKLETSAYNNNNTLLIRDKDGNISSVVVDEIRIVGRLTDGNIAGLTIAQVKEVLALDIDNVAGLQAELDGKSDTGHAHDMIDVTGLQRSLDDIGTNLTDLEDSVTYFE